MVIRVEWWGEPQTLHHRPDRRPVAGPEGVSAEGDPNAVRLFLGGVTILGAENIPAEGAVILASNHRAHVDPPYLSLLTPRPLTFMAKEELFQVPFFGPYIVTLGAFLVKRRTADRAALRRAVDLLKAGRAVVIFPEGTRSEDGLLQPAEKGFALIARQTGAPIVPIAIVGTERMLPKGAKWPRRTAVKITIGRPLSVVEILASRRSKEKDALTMIGEATMAAIAGLLGEALPDEKESKKVLPTP